MKTKLYKNKFFLLFSALLPFSNVLLAQAPSISSFSPTTGSPGKSITITGSNFNTTAGNNVVYFGATKANITSASSTQLVVNVPTGAISKPITVLNGGTGLSAASKTPFTVTVPPYTGQDFSSTSFKAAVAANSGIVFRGISVVDFDGDGKADVVGYSNSPSVVVSVARNTSTASAVSFAARQDFALPAGASGRLLTTGDVDNDGKIDIIIGSANSATPGLYVFRNTSTGSGNTNFTRVDFAADYGFVNFAISDLDGDGKPEIVASNIANATNTVMTVYKNNSTVGTFTSGSLTRTNITGNGAGGGIAIGDIDGDSKADVVVADQAGSNLSVFRNTSTGGAISFATKADFALAGSGIHYTVSLGDFDGDGKLDIVVPENAIASVAVFRNSSTSGTISLAARADLSLPFTSFGGDVSDLDGDGKLDIVALSSNKLEVFRNKATSGSLTTSSFAAAVEYDSNNGAGGSPNAIAIGDINLDGKPDLVPSIASSPYSFSVLTGTTGFALPLQLTTVRAYQKASGIQVEWTTASESNMNEYEVERSANSQQFSVVGRIPSKGNTNNLQTYSFWDAAPLHGANYYRIRSVSNTGEINYSVIVKVNQGAANATIAVYPNPVKGNTLSLQVNAMEKGDYQLTVYNTTGQPVLRKTIEHQGGSAAQTISFTNHLTEGIYQMVLRGVDKTITQTFMKE
jgi:hypothetical protein